MSIFSCLELVLFERSKLVYDKQRALWKVLRTVLFTRHFVKLICKLKAYTLKCTGSVKH